MHWFAAIGSDVSLVGFILQFVGLRAMHWSASIFQLSATVLMSLVRVWVRTNLTTIPKHNKLVRDHELDCLAKGMYHAKQFWREKHAIEAAFSDKTGDDADSERDAEDYIAKYQSVVREAR